MGLKGSPELVPSTASSSILRQCPVIQKVNPRVAAINPSISMCLALSDQAATPCRELTRAEDSSDISVASSICDFVAKGPK